MMHGRAGAYSSTADGVYNASTLSRRHRAWGELLSEEGYFALMVDGFGPRGYPHGFGPHTYRDRPKELNEVTVRPLDAYGALAYLRTLPGIAQDRIGLLGWSNGGSATLSALSSTTPALISPSPSAGFRAAVAFYPACTLKDSFKETAYRPYAPVRIFHGLADEETSPKVCAKLVRLSKAKTGSDIDIELFPGATHGFDDPSEKHQRVEQNAEAAEEAIQAALGFFSKQLRQAAR
jgi:carboxymethylenebutenolidase